MSKEASPQPRIKPTRTKVAKEDPLSELAPLPQMPDFTEAERRLLVFRKIAAPLMATLPSAAPSGDAATTGANQFAQLIGTTVSLSQRLSEILDLQKGDSALRWQAAAAASEIVAAHFRATGHALTAEEAAEIVTTLGQAMASGLAEGMPSAAEEPQPDASNLSRSLKALAPVASAITRFSFGRDPMDLLGEVVRRLVQIAGETAGKLEGTGQTANNTPLYFAVLEVTGEFYMESHFAEMTRLLEMAPDERKEYVQAHNRKIPMEPVWEPLVLKLGMLEALTSYLPGSST